MTGERVLVVSGGNEMFAYRTAVCLADDGFGVVGGDAEAVFESALFTLRERDDSPFHGSMRARP